MEDEVMFVRRRVTRDDILQAIRQFDRETPTTSDHANWLENPAYKFAVEHGGKLYPPKYILSLATGVDVQSFNGGGQTNNPLRRWGFRIIDKPSR